MLLQREEEAVEGCTAPGGDRLHLEVRVVAAEGAPPGAEPAQQEMAAVAALRVVGEVEEVVR